MRSTLIAMILSTLALSFITLAYGEEMTRDQVSQYMKNYDQEFEKNQKLMFENIEYGILVGQLGLEGADYCRSRIKKAKDIELSRLNPHDKNFHIDLGKVDGKWDGRKEGCSNAMQVMAQRKQIYENDIKPRWVNGVKLGQKVAAIQLELFSESIYKIESECMNKERVGGLIKFFMADEISPDDKLSHVQNDCQGQARVVVQVYEANEKQMFAESQQRRSDYGRRAASVQ